MYKRGRWEWGLTAKCLLFKRKGFRPPSLFPSLPLSLATASAGSLGGWHRQTEERQTEAERKRERERYNYTTATSLEHKKDRPSIRHPCVRLHWVRLFCSVSPHWRIFSLTDSAEGKLLWHI